MRVSGGMASKHKGHSSSGDPKNREKSGAVSASAMRREEGPT